ncbi:Y-family DNA polymerase [Alloprevotella tannerae]|uniref:Y-family DNA polymerase n=1 Tax=Alloprevotella tannerae TaxID=76122 RepID=UPI0025E3BD59|nr:Y-family DNA polymerase [Alloprevotella tannerae]
MWALADCNSFFCSVEKAFHPGLRGKPVCVLSSNDGNIVALTPEAKKIGIKRGDPVFKVRDLISRHDVQLFSTNMTLYAAMSRRVTNMLRMRIHHIENYSIDESFCCLDGYERFYDMENFMREIVEKVRLWTEIPMSVGIAPSKTLAKIGSKFAKQYKGYRSVCMIDTEEKRRKALAAVELSDVWGIGRRTLKKLAYYGVQTPLAFADKSENWVRSRFTLPMIRTWKELNGVDCIDTTEVIAKQTICTSRSFGNMVTKLEDLKASVAHFAGACANKLRGQASRCRSVTVFIATNRFREDLPQYNNILTHTLPIATADTLEITHTAIMILQELYRPGIYYKKSGVILGDISSEKAVAQNLFDHISNRSERHQLMHFIDNINQRYGAKTILLGIEGIGQQKWTSKCEQRTPNYLTDINEIMTIRI